MLLEDKILAYLDGTLDDESRAELLHSLSVSPEKRALLEEHLRLREMMSLGQKPLTVPLDVEQTLAGKLPMLIEHLPYLRQPANSKVAEIAAIGAWVAMRHFVVNHAVALSMAVIALIGTAGYYAVGASSGNSANDIAAIGKRGPSVSSYSQPVSSTGHDAASTDSGINARVVDGAHDRIEPMPTSHTTANHPAGGMNTSNPTDLGAEVQNIKRSELAGRRSTHVRQAPQNVIEDLAPQRASNTNIVAQSTAKAVEPSVAQNPPPEVRPLIIEAKAAAKEEIPSAPIASIAGRQVELIQHVVTAEHQASSIRDLLAPEQSSLSKFFFIAYGQLDETVLTSSNGQPGTTTPTMILPSLGAYYSLSPNLSIGLEAGRIRMSELATTASTTDSSGVGYRSISYSTGSQTENFYFGSLMGRFNFDPFESVHLTTSVGFGLGAVASLPIVISARFGLENVLTAHFSLLGEFGYEGSFLNSKPVLIDNTDRSSNSVIGIIRNDQPAARLFTSSGGIRIGLLFRP